MRFKAHVIQKNQYFVMTSSYACCCAANIDFVLHMREMATVKVFKAEFPSLGQLAVVGACVRVDVLLCVHSHALRHNSDR